MFGKHLWKRDILSKDAGHTTHSGDIYNVPIS